MDFVYGERALWRFEKTNIPELQLQEYCNILKKLQEVFLVHRFRDVHRCGASGSMRACHAAGPDMWSHTYFFDHTRTWRASPDEWSSQCRGHLRDSTNMKDNTYQAHSHPSKANMEWWRPNDILQRAHSRTFPSLHLCHNSFYNPSVPLPTSQLILQPFRCFIYVTVHSSTSSISNLSITSPTSQLIPQPFRRFPYVIAHSLTLPLLHLRHSSFSNELILQPFRHVTYVTCHSPTLPSFYLRYSSFSNPSVASPTSVYSPTLLSLLLRHKFFT